MLVGPAPDAATEQDDGGHGDVSSGKQSAEVGVGGDEHPTLGCRSGEDPGIVSSREPVAGHVDGVVAGGSLVARQLGREALVDEEC